MAMLTNPGVQKLLDSGSPAIDAAGSTLRLFTNDFTPGYNSIDSDFTQATFSGYTAPSFSAALPVASKEADGIYRSQTSVFNYTFSGSSGDSGAIYGWYIRLTDGTIVMHDRFAAPITLTVSNNILSFRVTLRLGHKPVICP